MSAVVFTTNNLAPYQVQLSNGIIVGAPTDVIVDKITGLRTLNTRTGDQPRPGDGAYAGLNFVNPRTISFTFQLRSPANGVENGIQMVTTAWQNIIDPASVTMTVGDYLRQQIPGQTAKTVSGVAIQLPGRKVPLISFGRPVKLDAPVDNNYQYGWVDIPADWESPDGLLYDNTIITGTCGLPNPASGARFNWTFPLSFGQSSGGNFQLNNTGAYNTPPVFNITGPCNTPTIINQTTNQLIRLNLNLGATDTVVIDCQAGTVTFNGANRNNQVDVTSTFFQLAPGTNSISFQSIDSTNVAGQLTGYAMPAYSVI